MARKERDEGIASPFTRSSCVTVLLGLVLHNALALVAASEPTPSRFKDEKNYYSPTDPGAGTPPTGLRGSPPPVSTPAPPYHITPSCPTPPSPTGNCGNPPNTYTPTPILNPPPTYGGGTPAAPVSLAPPIDRGTPSTPHITTPPRGSYYPSPPTYGGSTSTPPATLTPPVDPGTPSTPYVTTPPSGSYSPSPPTYEGGTPTTPVTLTPPSTPPIDSGTPNTPSISTPPSGSYYPSPPTYGGGTPTTPVILTPPTTPPIDPGTPSAPFIPSPPFYGDPNPNPPIGTYNYWSTNPGTIFGLFGWWVPMGTAFGISSPFPGFPSTQTLVQALSNPRTDGFGSLYREGTAALLNSMVNSRFPFTTAQVRESFASALASDDRAAAQAQLFKLANEGRLKP